MTQRVREIAPDKLDLWVRIDFFTPYTTISGNSIDYLLQHQTVDCRDMVVLDQLKVGYYRGAVVLQEEGVWWEAEPGTHGESVYGTICRMYRQGRLPSAPER